MSQAILKAVDAAVLAQIQRGEQPQHAQIDDWQKYIPGFIRRNASKIGVQRSWSVAKELDYAVRGILANIQNWVYYSVKHFSYERALQNTEFIAALLLLQVTLEHYYENTKPQVQRDYWDDDDMGPELWHIRQVNMAVEAFQSAIDLSEAFIALAPEPVNGIDATAAVTEVLPMLREFQAFLPEFVKVLDDNKIICVTERPMYDDWQMPSLNIELPSDNGIQRQSLTVDRIVHKIQRGDVQRGIEFEGFFIGIVQEPGTPDDRDPVGVYTSKEDLARACDWWAYNSAVVGINHREFPEQQGIHHPHFVCVRNWIQYGDTVIGGEHVKDGTWLQAYQCKSDEAKEWVRNYQINGLSPGGKALVLSDA
jgi:hypothetical protein